MTASGTPEEVLVPETLLGVIGVPVHLSEGPGVAVIEAIELVAKSLYQ